MKPNIQAILGTDSSNFETVKYNISNESKDILLDNVYYADLRFSARMLKS